MLLAVVACPSVPTGSTATVRVGSKAFTESVILGEMLAQLVRDVGVPAEHRRQLGGTQVIWGALTGGLIDVYVDYTGTLAEEVFGGAVAASPEPLAEAVAAHGIVMSAPLGFTNTYALGMREDRARELDIRAISDLARHPGLRLGFSTEFMNRNDGWPGLRATYDLPQTSVAGMEHVLAYRALEQRGIDATDLYTTDPEIAYYGLRLLEDDRRHFPDYRAVVLYRRELERTAPEVVDSLLRLEGAIDEQAMIAMNAGAQLERRPEGRVAADFLGRELDVEAPVAGIDPVSRLWTHTVEHLVLVGISLSGAILLALPLGILAARRPALGAGILAAVGVVQTIPSLALLVFMIPLLGIGGPPAIAALFLYSLLPIVRNTAAGLEATPGGILESADALGLPRGVRLRLIELPMAMPMILAGIKTAAVINVGTATLGALIGAGGYGQPILTGIRLDDMGLILQGAIPAAVLALIVQGGFALLERAIVPRGLRL